MDLLLFITYLVSNPNHSNDDPPAILIVSALLIGFLLINLKHQFAFRLFAWFYATASVAGIVFLTTDHNAVLRMVAIVIVLLLAMKLL